MKEYRVNKAKWWVYYVREDGQLRLATTCTSPSQAAAIKKELEKVGAKNVSIKEEIKIDVYEG